jgi:hypothetical protein
MRSTRVYQPSTPADRIMEIMAANDGAQLDQHLVRRFIGLMGVYPPGTVVRLSTGDIGVVVAAGGEHRDPDVRIVLEASGRTPDPPRRQRVAAHGGAADGTVCIESALDPAAYEIDAASCL